MAVLPLLLLLLLLLSVLLFCSVSVAERDQNVPLKMPAGSSPVISLDEFVLLANDGNADDTARELLFYRLIEAAVYAEEEVIETARAHGLAAAQRLYTQKLTPIYEKMDELWPRLSDDLKQVGRPAPLQLHPITHGATNNNETRPRATRASK
jgi:hypothetical protein